MNRKQWMAALIGGWAVALAAPAAALEVDENALPRIEFEGEFIGTLDYTLERAESDRDAFRANTDDTNVAFALDKHLYNSSAVGGAAVEVRLEDVEAQPRVRVFLASPRTRVTLGQMRLRNTLVRFPTVRGEDLLPYTHILNGSLGLEDEADQLYGENLVFDAYFRPSYWRLSLFAQERTQTEAVGGGEYAADEAAEPNGLGLSVVWEAPDAVRYEQRLRRLGLIVDAQELERRDGDRAVQTGYLAGGVVGLNENPAFPWELGLQAITTEGLDDRDPAGDPLRATEEHELAREAATAAVLSLHLADRTDLRTRWQAALTLAQKTYPDLADADQWSAAPALFWRLSSGLDLVAQAVYTSYSPGLADIVGRDERLTVQIGLSMLVEAEINPQVVDYDSILELEHGSTFQGM